MGRGKRTSRLKAAAGRWLDRRLETAAQAELINERIVEFERKLEEMERRGKSPRAIERERERMSQHIRRMEDARDGYGDWPEAEQAAVASIARRVTPVEASVIRSAQDEQFDLGLIRDEDLVD